VSGSNAAALVAVAAVPLLAMMLSAFVKTSVVMSLLRNALGAPQAPPDLVVTGIALLLTIVRDGAGGAAGDRGGGAAGRAAPTVAGAWAAGAGAWTAAGDSGVPVRPGSRRRRTGWLAAAERGGGAGARCS
jgi:hypothetical protein